MNIKLILRKYIIFNFKVKEKSKISIRVLFKNWRFNRDLFNLSHPFSIVIGKYDKNRKIERLWGNWPCEDDLNIIEFFEPGLYVIWLYVAYKNIQDKNFKYTVQVSSKSNSDIEFLGLDKDFLLIQYLLLENFKNTGKNNLATSKDYFKGSDKGMDKMGLINYLIYNKTGRDIQISATGKNVTNVELFPPYEGLNNV